MAPASTAAAAGGSSARSRGSRGSNILRKGLESSAAESVVMLVGPLKWSCEAFQCFKQPIQLTTPAEDSSVVTEHSAMRPIAGWIQC